MPISVQEANEALAPLLPAFESDGVFLKVRESGIDGLIVEFSKGPEVCEECVLPLESLEILIAESLREVGVADPVVRVVDVTPVS